MTISALNVKLITSLLFLLTLSTHVYAQTPDRILGKVNIASPNAAALGKFGDIPVSYHTGVPNISIPLFTMQEGDLTVPVSISYHSGGIRVDEHASNVGLGWALNAGGVITRTVKDKTDERGCSAQTQLYGHFSDYGFASAYFNYGQGITTEKYDGQPDLFSFNFGSISGKFFFNDDRTIVVTPQQDLKIEYNYPPDANPNIGQWNTSPGAWAGMAYNIMSFTITTPDGTKYYFGAYATPTGNYCDPIEVVSTFTLQGGTSYSQVISSWYLQKIVSSDGGTTITFNYLRDKYATYTFGNSPYEQFNSLSNVSYLYSPVKNLTAGVFLSSIVGPSTTVNFTPGIIRQDVSSWSFGSDQSIADNPNTTCFSLGGINVVNNSGNCVKNLVLGQDFFVDNITPTSSYFSGITYDRNRLRLNYIRETSCDGTIKNPPYIFQYFSETPPRTMSFGRDHWGFNNGAISNVHLYPTLYNGASTQTVIANTTPAIRDAAWPAMRAGTLNKIFYPTGGSTTLTFEPHTVTVNNSQGVPSDQIVGGLRIKSTQTIDPVANDTTITNYSYLGSTGYSTGVLYSRPTYIQLFRNDFWKLTRFLNVANYTGGWDTQDPTQSLSRSGLIYSDYSIRPMENVQGNHIGYSQVIVSQPKNGSSIFGYYATPYWQNYRGPLANVSITNPTPLDQTIPNYPAAPDTTDYMRGEMIYEAHLAQDGHLIMDKNITPFYSYPSKFSTLGRVFTIINMDAQTPKEAPTYYEIKVAKKVSSTVVENTYQPDGTKVTKTMVTNFGSPNHNQPTEVYTFGSDGKKTDNLTSYTFDFVVPFTEQPCTTQGSYPYNFPCGGNINFNSFTTQQYNSGNFANSFGAGGGYTSAAWLAALADFNRALFIPRYSWVIGRRNNYTNSTNNYQTNHNSYRTSADTELGPLLWAQDVFINAPVENSVKVDGLVTTASYTQYINTTGDSYGVFPLKSFKLDFASPQATFTPASVNGASVGVIKNSGYAQDVTVNYLSGRVSNAIGRDGIPSSYQWGYNNSVPIVRTINAQRTSTLVEFFFDGFEENTNANVISGSAHTGSKYWNANYTTSFAPPNSRAYIVQYWNLTGGTWVLNQQSYTNGMVLTGPIDDVRIFPANAQMTSYTYTPGIGITSQTDPAGVTTYYNYDKLSRLSHVADRNGKIVRQHQYNYLSVPSNPTMQAVSTATATSSTFSLGNTAPTASGSFTFTQTFSGPITVTMPALPPNAQVTMTVNLTGVSNSVYLCNSGTGGANCNNTPSTYTLGYMPAGTYTVSYTANTSFQSFTFNYTLSATYNLVNPTN